MSRWKFFLWVVVIELTFCVVGVSIVSGADMPALFKTYQMNRYDVAIQCLNGNKPLIISRLNKEIIVSCK